MASLFRPRTETDRGRPVVDWQRWLQRFLVGLLVGLLVVCALVATECRADWALELLGADDKNNALKFLGAIMGGVLVALNVVVGHRRAKAMEDAAAAQARGMERQAEANRLTEQGQRQERLKSALDRLGSKSPTQRFAAAYELVHLARETEELREPVLAIFCEHIRQTTRSHEYKVQHRAKPSTEIQSLLGLLFVREHAAFRGCRADLEECWLNGADLRRARLPEANLRGVRLDGARLHDARLRGAVLVEARLRDAELHGACLRDCNLMEARLHGARLPDARLQGASLLAARLTAASLRNARMQATDLADARLYAAMLVGAQMQAARIERALLQGAMLSGANLQGAGNPSWSGTPGFADRVRAAADKTDTISGDGCHAIFFGGLTYERAEQLAEVLPVDTARNVFWQQMRPHIDQPHSFEVPEDAGVVRGAYTAAEAEVWILEYHCELAKDE